MRRIVFVSVLVALAGSYANAATVYDLVSKKRAATDTFTKTVDSLLLTATGVDGNAPSKVSTTSKGLGVYAGRKDKWETDGAKSTETLWLEFDAAVTLDSLQFTKINRKNDWVSIFDSTNNEITKVNLALLAKGGKATLDLATLGLDPALLVGTKFGFGAVGKKDSFLLRQVSATLAQVGTDNQGEVSAELNIAHAPLPAPVLTGGALLAAMGATRLYRRLRLA